MKREYPIFIEKTLVWLMLSLTVMLTAPAYAQMQIDHVVTGEELVQADRHDLPTAVRMLLPESAACRVLLVDGQRASMDLLSTLSVYDIKDVRVVNDVALQAQRGISGAGILSLTTRTPERKPLKVSYVLDAGVAKAVGEADEGLPRQTGWRQQHKLTVEGANKQTGYLFSAALVPDARDVLKGMGSDVLALRSYVGYRSRSLALSNDISFCHDAEDRSASVRYLRQNSEGSFEKEKTATLTDRFGAELTLGGGLQLLGSFSFVSVTSQSDRFLSPQSGWFDHATEARQRGSYAKGRRTDVDYEGSLRLTLDRTEGPHRLNAEAGADIYSGRLTTEGYGGLGVLSDRMGYISFTLAYDTTTQRQASRSYDHTLRSWLTGGYEYMQRYGLTATAALSRSSLLAPDHKTVLHWAAQAYWHLHREAWLANAPLSRLTLAYAYGETGFVPFTWHDFTTTFRNQTDQQYVYNYYLTGTALQQIGNASLRPARQSTHQLSANAQWWSGCSAGLRLYRQQTSHLPSLAPQPLRTGFEWAPGDDGALTANGAELTLQAPVAGSKAFSLHCGLTAGYAHRSADNMQPLQAPRADLCYGSLQLTAVAGMWQCHVALGGDDDLGTSNLQLTYSLAQVLPKLHRLRVGLTAGNLVCWHPADVLLSRRVGLSIDVRY